MDITQTKDLIGWAIALIASSGIAIIIGIINIIKSGRLAPREIKGADLNNKSKEASIADQFEELATKATDKALNTQERLDRLETEHETMLKDYKALKIEYTQMQSGHMLLSTDYTNLKKEHDELKSRVEQQQLIINKQAEKLIAQDEEIIALVCESNNYKIYISALISQIKEAHITPVEFNSLPIKDCEKEKKDKEVKNGNKI